MRKIGGALALIAGLIFLVVGILALLVELNVITSSGMIMYFTIKHSAITIAGILIGLGAVQVILALFALGKPRGFASFILFQMFLFILIFVFVTALRPGTPPTGTSDRFSSVVITILSISGLLSVMLLTGIIIGNGPKQVEPKVAKVTTTTTTKKAAAKPAPVARVKKTTTTTTKVSK